MNLNITLTLLTSLTLGLTNTAGAAESVWISSLDLSPIVQGWGKPQADKSVTEKALTIAGKQFERGLGTHADGVVRIDLKGGAERFSALVGVDDAAASKQASIVFKVVADHRTVFKSAVMKLGDAAQPIDLDVRGIKTLLLLSDSAGDGTGYDHADWAEAKLVVVGERPEIVKPPAEKALVLTPKPPPQPRINGARIFGVRPGHPFLYKIPATGDRPMRFAAKQLPKGLKVDPQSGQITGAIAKPGRYDVTLQAANGLGKAARKFTIVCGDTLALTPHMGWNSWYVWENHVTDKIMREAADAMVSSGLINHGYQYVNIDDCWAVRRDAKDPTLTGEPRDGQGKVTSNPRFPDMKTLTDYIHGKGLKAGIYTSPGPRTCASHEGAYQHEELDVQRFVEWGFDFLKYDWCSYGEIAKNPDRAALQKPYQLIGDILKRQNRDVVLNLCQYGMGNVWEWGKQVGGHSWRTAGDLGLTFEGIAAGLFRDGFDVYSKNELHKYGGPGGWNDPDYLLLGYLSNWKDQTAPTPLTPNEQYTHVSLWCLVAAPLIFSGDMTRLDEFTLSLLSNDEVIDVDQDPLGRPGRRVALDEEREVWARQMEDGSVAVGLFNRGEGEAQVTAKWSDLGIRGPRIVRDLWRQQDLGKFSGEFKASVPRHGVVLVRIRTK
jgi:alpha-galactosidase